MTKEKTIKKAQVSKLIPLLLSLVTFSSVSFAGRELGTLNQTQTYLMSKELKLNGIIGEGVANRIEFGLLGFREIIGDESKYTFITDQNNKSIFLTPKVGEGEHVALSLVNQAGEIVDLDLTVQKTDGQVIKIDKKIPDQDYVTGSGDREVILMIKAMQKDSDSKGKYYVTSDLRTIPGNLEGISLNQDRTYRYGELVGSRIVITNLNKGLREIRLHDFKNLFEGSLAISIQKKVLRPKEKGFVYVMVREESDD